MQRVALLILPALLLASCAATAPSSALVLEPSVFDREAGSASHNAQGPYLGGMQLTQNLAGDLDQSILITGTAGTDFGTLPDFDDATGIGLGLSLGYRWERRSLEVNARYVDFGDEPEFVGFGLDTYTQGIGLDWKEYYFVESNLQPFLFLGVEWLDMTVEDGAFDVLLTEIDDLTLKGFGINLGGGANFYVTPRLALIAQAWWSFAEYDRAKTITGGELLDGAIDSDGWTLALGASYTF